MTRLEVRALRVSRGGREVVRSVTFRAGEGEILGVLGPSGAGKSTLFRALTGDLSTGGGSVVLEGVDVTHWPLWRRARAGVGYIPQHPSVLADLTVRQNLATFRHIVLGSSEGVEPQAAGVELSARLDVRAGDLSAGERRRLEFARATTRLPRVLICDEPFAGVDPAGARRLGELLGQLARGGVTVVLADHHVEEALAVCSRALLLLDGEIVVDDNPELFRTNTLVRGRYLGTWTGDAP